MIPFTPENDLERALMQAAANPSAQIIFYRLLLESDLFVLGKTAGQASESMPGGEIQLVQMRHKDRIYHPIFSSLSRIQIYLTEHPDYFTIKGRDLFASTPGAYFLLNPGSAYGKEFLPEEITALLKPNITPDKDTLTRQVLITQPMERPVALAEALRQLFEARPEVEAAYLGQIAFAGENAPPHPIVGVKLDGPWTPLAAEIGRAAERLHQSLRLAAIAITDDGPGKVIGDALMRYEPIYLRKSSLH